MSDKNIFNWPISRIATTFLGLTYKKILYSSAFIQSQKHVVKLNSNKKCS